MLRGSRGKDTGRAGNEEGRGRNDVTMAFGVKFSNKNNNKHLNKKEA